MDSKNIYICEHCRGTGYIYEYYDEQDVGDPDYKGRPCPYCSAGKDTYEYRRGVSSGGGASFGSKGLSNGAVLACIFLFIFALLVVGRSIYLTVTGTFPTPSTDGYGYFIAFIIAAWVYVGAIIIYLICKIRTL
jgi:hypothetical protein